MAAIVQFVQMPSYFTQQRQEELTQQIAQYRQLRARERRLREEVAVLESQIARFGPLEVPPNKVVDLKEEQAQLEELRGDIDAREQELVQLTALPPDQLTAIQAERLQQVTSDIRAKREQFTILQDNIRFLEEQLSQYGGQYPGVALTNQLKSTRQELNKVQAQLQELEARLKDEWQLEPNEIQLIETMSDQALTEFVAKAVERSEQFKRQRVRNMRAQLFAKALTIIAQYDDLVKSVLAELRQATYPTCTVEAHQPGDYGISHDFDLDRDREEDLTGLSFERSIYKQQQWTIVYTASYGAREVQLTVTLNLNAHNNPVGFRCQRLGADGTNSADLSRDALIKALTELHRPQNKPWWQFWRSAPALPANWV